ncbi:MAG: TlpA disulfide reductase family protein [Proteobacteria bacterium]|nr:TlpA disulfide reductase family protein [Pseudomonadota bacterium]
MDDNLNARIDNTTQMKAFLFILCWLLAASIFAKTPGEVAVGAYLREAPLYGFFGDFRKLSELRGKPLIINVWASWCGPCRAEMGSLERLSRRFGGKKIQVIGISTDDDAGAAAAFLQKARVTFDNYHDKNLLLENMLGANTIPLTVLVDAQGRVVKRINGYLEWDSPETLEMISKAFRLK